MNGLKTKIQLKKFVSFLLVLPFFILLLYTPFSLSSLLISFLALGAMWEFYAMLESKGLPCSKYFGLLVGWLLNISFAVSMPGGVELAISCVILLILLYELFRRNEVGTVLERVSLTSFGILYIGLFLGYLIRLRARPDGRNCVIFLLLATWSSSAAAGMTGRFLGKHSLPARINPRKTVEGIVGGVAFSVLFAIASQTLFMSSLNLAQGLVLGILLGIATQAGDLIESILKRSAGIKDSSQLLPNLGGVLDMMDSVLLTAPSFYAYLSYLGQVCVF